MGHDMAELKQGGGIQRKKEESSLAWLKTPNFMVFSELLLQILHNILM